MSDDNQFTALGPAPIGFETASASIEVGADIRGTQVGVRGHSQGPGDGDGVQGFGTGTFSGVAGFGDPASNGTGTFGQGTGPGAPGVRGLAGTGNADGVQGFGTGTFSGVAGFGDPASSGTGVFGQGRGPGAPGVRGIGSGGPNTVPLNAVGVYGQGGAGPAPGVLGTSTTGTGILGTSGDAEFATGVAGVTPSGIGGDFRAGAQVSEPVGIVGPIGVRASATVPVGGSPTRQGMAVLATSTGGTAVLATSSGGGTAVLATSTGGSAGIFENSGGAAAAIEASTEGTGPAALFIGDVRVTGTLTAGAKNFVVDHPLDPANKYLAHTSVESCEQASVYSGNIVLDDHGEAGVNLPAWVEALCEDFRYQLTGVGGSAPVYIADEVADNQFRIAGGPAGMKVSWQLTGIRKDAWAKAHPLVVEQDKPEGEKGIASTVDARSAPVSYLSD